MLDFSAKPEPAEEWSEENIHNKLPGLCLASSSSSKGGYGVIASCSTKTDLRVYSTSGRQARSPWRHAWQRAGRCPGEAYRQRPWPGRTIFTSALLKLLPTFLAPSVLIDESNSAGRM